MSSNKVLHLISLPSTDSILLQRINSGDDVVFLENSIFRINKNGSLKTELQQMLLNKIAIHVLAVDLETRGIDKAELTVGVKVINYADLVDLTVKNKTIKTWN